MSSVDLEWLQRWSSTHGRPLRVLHIGNIANNAYINAKIQRARGIDADVLCYDYYHVMGAPEWEDAAFTGDVGDDAFPDWAAVDLHGFERPRWFVQGRLETCRAYLLARREGRTKAAVAAWRRLRAERWLACRRTVGADATRIAIRLSRRVGRKARNLVRLVRAAVRRATRLIRTGRKRGRYTRNPSVTKAPDRQPSDVEQRFRRLFPDRAPFDGSAYAAYESDAKNWRRLLGLYDVVQAYALDPAIPFAAGVPYVAYEHGTIRQIPFEDTPRGQLCALTYRSAEAVFVTNSDNLAAARRLSVEPGRRVALPHAVDSDRLVAFRQAHDDVRPGDRLRIFSPSRQDWLDGHPDWTKGNDRLLYAVASLVDHGIDFELVLVSWGRDLEATRRLVEELGLHEHVTWRRTLRKEALWLEYLRSHVVADQFVLPAFGAVTFEALALGRRVITSLDVRLAAEFFGEPPPLLVASSPEEITRALLEVAADPSDQAERGRRGADWFTRRHSSDRIVALQVEAYRRMLEPAPAAA